MAEVLRPADAASLADLATLVGRARRVDPEGAARLVGHGDVLAVYVSPLHAPSAPVILGLRTLRLARVSDVDVTVPLAALAEQLIAERGGGTPLLELPSSQAVGVAWAGVTPPRTGWQPVARLSGEVVAACAAAGIAAVREGVPAGSGAAAVTLLRGRVWGRPLVADLPDLPAGVAFAAEALGFLGRAEDVAVYRSGAWWRVTSVRGHVLARRSMLL